MSPECDNAVWGSACAGVRGIVRVGVCEEGLGWHGICVCDAMNEGVTEVAEDSLAGTPVTLEWIVGVPTEETYDEREFRAGAVGEVSETANSCLVRGGGL